jgi:hypothetical protein
MLPFKQMIALNIVVEWEELPLHIQWVRSSDFKSKTNLTD